MHLQNRFRQMYFLASEGDAQLLESAGIPANRLRVSGVPAFDHLAAFVNRKFRTSPYVLVCTSAIREKGGREDRVAFLEGCRRVAGDRKLIFQLHPLEKHRFGTEGLRPRRLALGISPSN